MKFRTKLSLGFGFIFVIVCIFALIVYNTMSEMNSNMKYVVSENYNRMEQASKIRSDIASLSRELGNFVLIEDERKRVEYAQASEAYLTSITMLLDQMKRTAATDRKPLLMELTSYFQSYSEEARKILAQMNTSQIERIVILQQLEDKQLRQKLVEAVNLYIGLHEADMEETLTSSNVMFSSASNFILISILATLLLMIIVSTWVSRSIIVSFGRLASVMGQVTANKLKLDTFPRVPVHSDDEIGNISKAYNRMAEALEEHAEHEREYACHLEQQNWLKSKIAELTLIIQGAQELHQLAAAAIQHISPAIGAEYGVIYLANYDGPKALLVRAASYAAGDLELGGEQFLFGEGLVGQSAAEYRTILLDNVPGDRIRIRSGLIESTPTQIMIVPVSYRNEVTAVVEFAAIHSWSPLELALLEELLPFIGASIYTITKHTQIQTLLKESQAFSEELQAQSEELQLQQEELRTLNEQLEKQYMLAEQKSSELESSKLELEEKSKQIIMASQYKTEFLANMSHELRTPLNSLLILSQMLADNKEGNMLPKQLEYARTIHTSGYELLRLINDILDLSKIESGKMELMYDYIQLQELEAFALQQFSPIASSKSIRFEVKVHPALQNSMIQTDIIRLQQIINNLLSNAMKFTLKGQVELNIQMAVPGRSASRTMPDPDQAFLAISVSDTGIGIPEDKLSMIFEAFQQADGTTSRRFGGTGLGLSISKEIAQLLGGFIEVESKEGQGSTFTLLLPVPHMKSSEVVDYVREAAVAIEDSSSVPEAAVTEEASKASKENPPRKAIHAQFKGKRVLLVDDDMRNIYALTTLLESCGMEVQFAENGMECLDMLRKDSKYHLVLMDIMMPILDGYESIKRIRSMQQFENLPIIALTAKAMKDDRDKCIEAGASDYISKPIHVDQLLSLFSVWLH
jgi:two-component system, chemotaxis family, sensor kinase CheA